ncbi:MAG TPA: carboxypeptidase regulatory-like domain-containing protein [Candidatus Polarisedimenticolia bacterium]|nr:carboxypeptidase regulatory-like domain-containing protein [Candidatus Polarisedimenticolia bacterium]
MPIHRREVRASGRVRLAAGAMVAAAIAAAAPPVPAAVRLVPPAAHASSRQGQGDPESAECKDGAPGTPGCPAEMPARLDEWPARGARPSAGRLEGTVNLGERLKQKRMRFALYPQDTQQALAGTRRASARGERDDEYRNVVVYLESTPALSAAARAGAAPASPSGPLSIRQEGLAFVPHVLPVLRGTTVEFPNTDPVFHNVFSLARAATFDLGRYPRGDARSVRFDAPGTVKVFCHIHSDMSAVVLVLDNPFFVVPDSEGRFRLEGLPPGEYQAAAWHERARLARRKVRIETGRATTVTFDIPLSEDGAGD